MTCAARPVNDFSKPPELPLLAPPPPPPPLPHKYAHARAHTRPRNHCSQDRLKGENATAHAGKRCNTCVCVFMDAHAWLRWGLCTCTLCSPHRQPLTCVRSGLPRNRDAVLCAKDKTCRAGSNGCHRGPSFHGHAEGQRHTAGPDRRDRSCSTSTWTRSMHSTPLRLVLNKYVDTRYA